MTTYRVTAPDGTKFKVNAPEGATQEEALAYAQEQFKPKEWEGSSNQEKKPFSVAETLKNVPGSAYNFATSMVSGLANAVSHPIDTLKPMLLAAEGGVRNLAPGLTDSMDTANPFLKRREGATKEDAVRTADAVGGHFAKRYGGMENIAETVQSDPVGALADASTLLGIGGATLPGKASQVLNTASKATNPLSVIPPVINAAKGGTKAALGVTTGTGADTLSQAYNAGKEIKPDFLKNLKGDVPITDVLDTAKQGLQNMRAQKSADYRSNMASVSGDKTVLGFGGIDQALSDAGKNVFYKGQVKNPKAAQALEQMWNDVAEWKALDPKEFHTPEGLDALKQKLGATLESIPFEAREARTAAGKVYNSVKAEIQKQAPTYAKTMEDYSKASEQIGEIERALSLGDKAAKDTAIRKLQSLTRNNVQTNYGNRLSLAKDLESKGGIDIMPALAGQAMSSLTPRGIVGQAGAYGTAAAAMASPYSLLALPFQSPRTVGLGAYGAGRAAGALGRGADLVGLTPERARLAGLLGYELGQ